jgi:hypothetical protein
MIAHDSFEWTNAAIGSVGLLLTVVAIVQATGAKRAATDAREAVHHRNAAESFAEIVRLAKQFATWVECERRSEAVVQVREIVLRIARDRGEFGRFLSFDADTLEGVESSCQRLADFLGQGEFPLSATAKADLFRETLKIVQDLGAVLGRVRARIEEEER